MIIHDKYMEEKLMIEIRFHGRGGQGAVTAAEILAKAAFKDGNYSQLFHSLELNVEELQSWLSQELMTSQLI